MKSKKKEIRPVSKEGIKQLEEEIIQSSDIKKFTKKTLIWMIRKSKNLTNPIGLYFPPKYKKIGKEVAFGVHDICSSTLGSTHINSFMRCIKSSMVFYSYGDGVGGHTVSIAIGYYDKKTKMLPLNIDEIKSVEI